MVTCVTRIVRHVRATGQLCAGAGRLQPGPGHRRVTRFICAPVKTTPLNTRSQFVHFCISLFWKGVGFWEGEYIELYMPNPDSKKPETENPTPTNFRKRRCRLLGRGVYRTLYPNPDTKKPGMGVPLFAISGKRGVGFWEGEFIELYMPNPDTKNPGMGVPEVVPGNIHAVYCRFEVTFFMSLPL